MEGNYLLLHLTKGRKYSQLLPVVRFWRRKQVLNGPCFLWYPFRMLQPCTFDVRPTDMFESEENIITILIMQMTLLPFPSRYV